MSEEKINRVLVATDISNFEHVVINSAYNKWKELYRDDAAMMLKTKEETDQANLPNLLHCDSFRRVIHKVTQDKLSTVIWIAKNYHQPELDLADGIDVFFAEDSNILGNFRKKAYPQYKANRKLIRGFFDKHVLKKYIQDVLFKELEVEEKLGYKIVKVENSEADDIIAVLMDYCKNYLCRILISSDHDFLQLDNVFQYDMWGNIITRKIKEHEEFTMTPIEYLYWKILKGDVSDNIKNVFPRVGDVNSYRLIKNKPLLKKMLLENQEAANRFTLNKHLIDFAEIPKDLRENILAVIEEKMKTKSIREEAEKFNLKGCLEL